MSHHARKLSLASMTSAIALLSAGPVLAQSETGADDSEIVIVTTERRAQDIQNVAATVQTFNQDELNQLGINDEFSNLQFAVPGLQIANQEGKVEIFLRGIGNSDSDFSSDPAVATHFNGIYVARPRGIGPLFFDTERVEINKGPQGTLRGRNATGGTINIISRRPDFDGFSGYVRGGVSNFSGREFEGAINIPITEDLAIRGSVWYKKHDGLYTNAFLDEDSDFRTPSAQDDVAGRISLLWEPNDNLSVYLLYQQSDTNSSGDPGTFGGRSLGFGFDVPDLDDPWDQYFRTEGDYDQNIDNYLAVITYDFGKFGVEYNGSYRTIDAFNSNASREWQLGFNWPGSEAEAAFIASGANPQRNLLVNDTFRQGDNSDSLIQEVRFYSTDADSRLFWTVGGFYFKEEFDFVSWDVNNGFCGNSDFFNRQPPVGPDTISCWQDGLGGENRGDDSEVESIAFYGDATYDVTDNLRIKGGVRWTRDEKTQNDWNVSQYQFTFNRTFLEGLGFFNEPSDLIIGEKGFALANPGDRRVPATFQNGTGAGVDLFLDGIQSFGLGDTFGLALRECSAAGTCDVFVRSAFDDPNTPDVVELAQTTSVEDSFVDWRAGIEYDVTEDNLLYFTASTGTRSGGVNRPLIVAGPDGQTRVLARTWEPEQLLSYEVGSKNRFNLTNDIPAIINASIFYYQYTDRTAQVLVDVDNPSPDNPDRTTQQVFVSNVGDADVFGVEVEGQFILPHGFNVGMNVLYLDTEFENTNLVDPTTNTNVSIDGNRLQNTSKWNLNARISQTIELPDAGFLKSIDWTANILYRTEFFLTPFNNQFLGTTPNNNTALSDVGGVPGAGFFSDVVDDLAIINLNMGLNFGEDEQFRLDGYVENVTREAFSTKGFVNSSVNIRYLNAPRIYGVRLQARF